MKGKNPIAKALRSPHLKHQVVKDKTKYNRKKDKYSGQSKPEYFSYVCIFAHQPD